MNPRLTDAQIIEIRRRRGESRRKLATEFRVSERYISVIISGQARPNAEASEGDSEATP